MIPKDKVGLARSSRDCLAVIMAVEFESGVGVWGYGE